MLKIALINGSPKAKESASGCILEELRELLKDATITEIAARSPDLNNIEALLEQEVLVFAFPLYVDGIPSHLLHILNQLEQTLKERKSDLVVYAIVNSGFYEGRQNEYALQLMRNWCVKANVRWGQGLGIGAGGMLSSIRNVPNGQGPKKNISIAMKALVDNIMEKKSGDNFFTAPNFPRFLYKMAAEMGWRQMVKANGLKTKNLFTKK